MSNHIDHFEALFNSTYLRWFDLNGSAHVVTIQKVVRDVELTMRGGKKDKKPIIHFAERNKPLVMNKTNMRSIADLHGVQPSKWIGKQVELYPSTTDMYDTDLRKMVTRECIRIRAVSSPNAKAQHDGAMSERKQQIVELRDYLNSALNGQYAEWSEFAAWAGTVLGKTFDVAELGSLTDDQIATLKGAAMDAVDAKENA